MGKIFKTLFFLVFLLFGLAASVACVSDSASVAAERKWAPTECTILHSSLAIAGSGYRPDIQYRYTWQGRSHIGMVYLDGDAVSNDASDVDRLVDQYAPGSIHSCRVNPVEPAKSVLAASQLWNIPVLLAGLPFLLVGAFGIWFIWRPVNPDFWEMGQAKTARILGSIFTLVGLGLFLGLALPGFRHYWSAESWAAIPYTVESSRVHVAKGGARSGDSYIPDVLYRYQLGDRMYRSNRYYLSNLSSSWSDSNRIVNRHSVGTHGVCYVDPADPYFAVLNRDLGSAYLFLAPFSLVFALVGIAALIYGLKT